MDLLLRLFRIGVTVEIERVRPAVHPIPLETLWNASLMRLEGNRVTAGVRLDAFDGAVFASDPCTAEQKQRSDFVIKVGGASENLARLTIRQRFERTLDLGRGCGIHAQVRAGQMSGGERRRRTRGLINV